MCAVAIGRIAGAFAQAQERLAVFFRRERLRLEPGALVRTVAERLVRGMSAGAEIIGLALFQIDRGRGVASDFRVVRHEWIE